ncbi:MAG TPA: hypothetical protein P5246_06050, partial [Candidatus Omnitrophota bacterium]|nr:hypothetical protein [Candidatus Omnitrophota bacterium]
SLERRPLFLEDGKTPIDGEVIAAVKSSPVRARYYGASMAVILNDALVDGRNLKGAIFTFEKNNGYVLRRHSSLVEYFESVGIGQQELFTLFDHYAPRDAFGASALEAAQQFFKETETRIDLFGKDVAGIPQELEPALRPYISRDGKYRQRLQQYRAAVMRGTNSAVVSKAAGLDERTLRRLYKEMFPDPTRPRIMRNDVFAYNMALARSIAKFGTETVVYGLGGVDLTNALAITNGGTFYIIDQQGINPPVMRLQWGAFAESNISEDDYVEQKYRYGFGHINTITDESALGVALTTELQCLGLSRSDVVFDQENGLPYVEFRKAFDGKDTLRRFYFVKVKDIADPKTWPASFKKKMRGKADVYLQNASMKVVGRLARYAPAIGALVKKNGVLVIDPYLDWVKNPQRVDVRAALASAFSVRELSVPVFYRKLISETGLNYGVQKQVFEKTDGVNSAVAFSWPRLLNGTELWREFIKINNGREPAVIELSGDIHALRDDLAGQLSRLSDREMVYVYLTIKLATKTYHGVTINRAGTLLKHRSVVRYFKEGGCLDGAHFILSVIEDRLRKNIHWKYVMVGNRKEATLPLLRDKGLMRQVFANFESALREKFSNWTMSALTSDNATRSFMERLAPLSEEEEDARCLTYLRVYEPIESETTFITIRRISALQETNAAILSAAESDALYQQASEVAEQSKQGHLIGHLRALHGEARDRLSRSVVETDWALSERL